jgi:hypothetical protein
MRLARSVKNGKDSLLQDHGPDAAAVSFERLGAGGGGVGDP